jgi:hypothetical protein
LENISSVLPHRFFKHDIDMFKYFLFLFFFALLNSVNAQDEPDSDETVLALPDTLMYFDAENVVALKSLEAVGKIIDTLEDSKAVLIRTSAQRFGGSYAVAVPTKRGYKMFDLLSGEKADSVTFASVDFNGHGNNELVVRWSNYAGHTGYENSIHEHERNIRIWDLDSLRCLMSFRDYYSYQNWWTVYAPDSSGTKPYEDREEIESGGELRCETYDVTIKLKAVTIVQTNNCPDQGADNEPEVTDPSVYTYMLTRNGLVKK